MNHAIRLALPEEAPLAAALWADSAQWQRANDKPAWSDDDLGVDRALRRIADGELYLGFEGEAAFGCFALQAADPVYWPEDPPGFALYLHKLATDRARAGLRLGERLIHAAHALARAKGLPLRLDCAPQPRLMAFYESCGFRRVEKGAVIRDGFLVVRYERA